MDTNTPVSTHSRKLLAPAVALVFVVAIVAYTSPRFLKGSLLTPDEISMMLKLRSDTDNDFVLTTREIRRGLTQVIRDVILQNANGDITGDGTKNQADISAAVQAFRSLLTAVCGNTQTEAGEQCDDGNQVNTDSCDNVCRTVTANPVCGNGNKETGETCDDSNTANGDGCNGQCSIESGFTCIGNPSVCTRNPVCGNGRFDGTESCDDGNTANGDGCTSQCTVEAGSTCSGEPSECSNGNGPVCGNSAVELPEECDNGPLNGQPCQPSGSNTCAYCSAQCRNVTVGAVCGNGDIEGTEVCDDQNITSGDGCSNQCSLESGFTCTGEPSQCAHIPVGNLFVTKSATISGPHQILGGTSLPVLGLEFTAQGEAIALTDLQVSFQNPVTSIDRLTVAIGGQTYNGTVGACGSDAVPPGTFCFSFGNGLIIPAGQKAILPVAVLARTDVFGAQAGQVVIPRLDTVMTNLTAHKGTVRARGVTSGVQLAMNDADGTAEGEVFIGVSSPAANAVITGDHHQFVLSKISGITNMNSDPDGTPIPVDSFAVGRFQISAESHSNTQNGLNDISPKDMIIDVHAANVQLDPAGFFIKNDAEDVQYPCIARTNQFQLITTPAQATGDFHLECTSTDNPLALNVPQGSSNIFKVVVSVVDPQVNPDQPSGLKVFLQNASNYANQQTDNFSYPGSHFRWIDMDSGATQFIWADGIPSVITSPLYTLNPINL